MGKRAVEGKRMRYEGPKTRSAKTLPDNLYGVTYAIPHGILTHRSQIAYGTPFPVCPFHGRQFDPYHCLDRGYVTEPVFGPFVCYDIFTNGRPTIEDEIPNAQWSDWKCQGHILRILGTMNGFYIIHPGIDIDYYWPEPNTEYYPAVRILLRSLNNGSDPSAKNPYEFARAAARYYQSRTARIRAERDNQGSDPPRRRKRRKHKNRRDN